MYRRTFFASLAIASIDVAVEASSWEPMMVSLGQGFPFVLPEIKGAPLSDDPARPPVPPIWTSDLDYAGTFAGTHMEGRGGSFHYDRDGKKYRLTYNATESFFRPNASLVQDQVTIGLPNGKAISNLTFGAGDDGVCLPGISFVQRYVDMFSWAKVALPGGERFVGGDLCHLLFLRVPTIGVELSMCQGADGFPREYNVSFRGHSKGDAQFRFYNFRTPGPDAAPFGPTEACAEHFPRQPCPDAQVSTLDVYRIFGPPEPLELSNRNCGDVLGDLAFVCTQGSGSAYEKKAITQWKVNVSHSFGQYSLCNYVGSSNSCSGPPEQRRTVGRRSGQFAGIGKTLGQCTPNFDVGSQYSFPAEAMCPPGVDPAAESGCAWGGAVPVRTIPASCLMQDRGLLKACAQEVGHSPFTLAAQIWERAFASDDPAVGGCPDAPNIDIVVV